MSFLVFLLCGLNLNSYGQEIDTQHIQSTTLMRSPVGAGQSLNTESNTNGISQTKMVSHPNENKLKTSTVVPENQSPIEAMKGKKEDVSKRDLYSKTYVNEDGSFTALIGAGPIHYQKNGQFLDIDTKVVQNPNAQFPYANTANLMESYFGATAHKGVKSKTTEGEVLEFLNAKMYWEVNGQAVNTQDAADTTPVIDNDKVTYPNIYGSISAEYQVLVTKRELNYIIPSKQALGVTLVNADYLVFSEDILLPMGWTAATTNRGIVVKDNLGKEIYLYSNPVSKDVVFEMTMSENSNTIFESFQIGQMLTVKTKVKTEWLLSNERVFPVRVDPTVDVKPDNSTSWTGWSTEIGGNDDVILVGNYQGGDPPAGPSYPLAGFSKYNLSTIPNGSTINSVSSNHYKYSELGGSVNGNSFYIIDINVDPVIAAQTAYSDIIGSSNLTQLSNTHTFDNNNTGWKTNNFNQDGVNFVQNALSQGYVAVAGYRTGSGWGIKHYSRFYGYSSNNYKPYLRIDYTELTGCTSGDANNNNNDSITPNCTGTDVFIKETQAGRFTRVTLTEGVQYTFSSSVGTDFLTITNNPPGNGGNPTIIFASGISNSGVTYTPTTSGTYRFYLHTSGPNICGTSNDLRNQYIKCSQYCAPVTQTPSFLYINKVAFTGTLNQSDVVNNSTYNATGYQDFTDLPDKAIQSQGQVVNVIAETGIRRGRFKAWVDWDKDGVFDNTNERVFDMDGYVSGSTFFGFIIPQNQTPGDYRIRIRVSNRYNPTEQGGKNFNPCEKFQNPDYGEAEDYMFTVIEDCPAKITGVNIGPDDGYICGSGSVHLTVSGVNATGYNWYSNEYDGVLLQSGPNNYYNTSDIGQTTTYWVTATNGSCETVYRTPVVARVDPVPTITFDVEESEICGEGTSVKIESQGAKEEHSLIDEKFTSGFGVFQNVNGTGSSDGDWKRQNSPYQVDSPFEIYRPALSSGHTGGYFAVAITDISRNDNMTKYLELTNPVDASPISNLKLEYDLFFKPFKDNYTSYLHVQVKIGSGDWTTIKTYNSMTGTPGKFKRESIDMSSYQVSDLKIRFKVHSPADNSGWVADIAAVDNIRLYGMRDLDVNMDWTGVATGSVFNSDCITPYNGATNEICIKPTADDLENKAVWNVVATASLSNGCAASGQIDIVNKTKFWNPAGATTDWAATNQWKPATPVPTADNCVIVKKQVNLLNGTDGLAKNLRIKSGGKLQINGEGSLTVTDYIINEASENDLIVKHDGNLIQVNDVTANSGSMTVEKEFKFSGDRKQYNFVTAPVDDTNKDIKSTIYTPNPTSVQAYNESTYYFDEVNGKYIQAKGYAVKEAPGTGTATVTGNFKGNISNGEIFYPLQKSANGGGYNLVGNPYPSNLDIKQLYDNNGSTKMESDFYFWDNKNNTLHIQQGSSYNGDHYAKFNAASGGNGTGNAAPCKSEQNGGYTDPQGCNKIPNRYVKVGTGFMVQAKGNYTLDFKNAHRTTSGTVGFFGKPSAFENEDDRYWLTMTSPSGITVMNAVVYFDGGKDDFWIDDTESFGPSDDLFTIVEDKQLAIQGKSPFNDFDKVPLGYRAFEEGYYFIQIYDQEGVFAEGQTIYILDKQLNKLHNLSNNGAYKFLTRHGEFTNRFEILYRPFHFWTNSETISNQIDLVKKDNQIIISSSIDKITEVEVFDLNSRSVYKKTGVNSKEHSLSALSFKNQIIVVTVKTDKGEFVTKKFVNN